MLFVTTGAPVPTNNMLSPYFLDTAGNFMNYTADGFTNAAYTHTSLTGVDSNSIVSLAGGGAVSGTTNVYALRTAGALTGTATDSLVIDSGGLILASASTHTAPIAFGSAEGVIFDTGVNNTLSGKLTGSGGLIKAGSGITTLNASNSATLSGPVTINQGTLRVVSDVGALASGSVITLNGGALEVYNTLTSVTHIFTNAIVLGNLGGMLGATTIKTGVFIGNITGGAGTGPLMLYATGNAYMEIAGTNSYTGGTVISLQTAARISVQPQSSLGTGDVTVDGGGSASTFSTIMLQGDTNISSVARVFLVNSGSRIYFNSANPSIGSLEGNGFVLLGVTSLGGPGQTANTRLTVGGNNLSTEFFGRISDMSSCFIAGGQAYNQLAKVGTGTLTLWGENAYMGGTVISNGTLTVNNYINTNGWVAVYPQGTLDGIGTVGPVTNLGGTVKGKLFTSGLTQGAGAVLQVAMNGAGAGQYDVLTVTGPVNLAGSTLTLTLNFAPTPGQTFTILNNTSANPIVGEFTCGRKVSGIYNGKTYWFSVNYQGGDGNDIVLACIPSGSVFTFH